MNIHQYDKRKYILAGTVLLVLTTYIIQLFNLQIVSDQYKSKADSNAFYKKTIYPARGHMYDRNGKLLVYNRPAYDITFVPREAKNIDTLELCNALNITREEFETRMERVRNSRYNPGYSSYTEQVFITQLPAEEFAQFQSNS